MKQIIEEQISKEIAYLHNLTNFNASDMEYLCRRDISKVKVFHLSKYSINRFQ